MTVARRLVHVLLIVLTLIVGATAAAIIVSQTAWFKNWLRVYIVREANQYLNGTLSIERLGGNLFFGIEMENIGLSMDGSQVVAVKDLGLDYSVFELISKGLSVDNIRLDKPTIYLRREGDSWSITKLVKKQASEADRSGPARPISIDEIGIRDGTVVVDGPVGTSGVDVPKRIDRIDAKMAFKYEPIHYSIDITHVSFRGSDPSIAVNALSGGVSVRDDAVYMQRLALRTAETSLSVDGAVQHYLSKPTFNLQVSSDKLSLPEISRLVPALSGIALQPAFELKLNGPLDRLGVDMNVRSSAGQVVGQFVTDVMTPGQSVNGQVLIRHLDLAPLLRNPKEKSDITATVKADVRASAFSNLDSLRGTIDLAAPRVAAAGYAAENVDAKARFEGRHVAIDGKAGAYGALATAKGHVTLPKATGEPLAYDVAGDARHVDLQRLPPDLKAPAATTDINAEYHVAGGGDLIKGDARFQPSTVAGMRIAPGSTVAFDKQGADLGYRADASVSGLDLQRVGREFKVPSLASDRYRSDLNAHVTADGHGTSPKTMDVTARGAITDSSIMGGHVPQLAFDASLTHDTAHVKANGGFDGFDPGALSGKPALKGAVGGSLDVDATVNGVSTGVKADNVAATARLNLQPSTVGGLAIDKANVDADYHDMTGVIRSLDVAGRDVNVQATGTIALNQTGQSNLKFHADSPSLDEVGKLVNQPLSGIAKVDGTITGNRTALTAQGNFTGDGIAYGENRALTLSTNYTVHVPDLAFDKADVTADTNGTFVTVAGQNINELAAKTKYANKNVAFDVTAKQPQRALAATGDLLLHPDHQEVHLQQLGLDSQGQRWQTASGSQPAIQYGGNAVSVKGLTLVSGNQRITADGTWGQPGEALKVSLNNVDLAAVDALMLRPPQLTGRLSATSVISGTKAAPDVSANFTINQGGFRQFHYDAFTGSVKYARSGVTLDTRLQQSASAVITAKGYLPTALFSAGRANGPTAESANIPAADRVDLRVESSPIDLGLVQGFTTDLTNVKGTLQANVHIVGTAADPHPEGAITVQNGAFTVVPTGVAYTALDGRIELAQDRIRIDDIRVLDNQQKPLTVSGELAVHEKQLGGVTVAMKADDFKVIDNKMGNVRINSNLQFAGQLSAPRLQGDLGITTGVINLDPILDLFGTSAYALKPTEYATGAQPTSDKNGQTAPPSAFDALSMNVHVTVPNDLVVKASDLRTPGSPVGLGAMNFTLGGDLRAVKRPGSGVRLVGVVNTVRGTYDFQGRRFTLQRDGTVRFEGLDQIDPTLDITAQRLIQGVEANVHVRGTLQKPEIELSSVPPLDQADILALIVFNQPINQLGEGQQISLAQRASSIATGAVAGALANSIGNALNLDTFEIQMAPDTGSAAQLTVGEQLGERLYVKVQQGIGDVASTNFILEYELTNWLRLQSNIVEGATTQQSLFRRAQATGVDLIFFFSY